MAKIDRSLRIRKLVPNNPRQEQTHGWYAWECLGEGMTVQEYLDAPFNKAATIRWQKRPGRPCTGPDIRHLQWDIEHGFCELYSDPLDARAAAPGRRAGAKAPL